MVVVLNKHWSLLSASLRVTYMRPVDILMEAAYTLEDSLQTRQPSPVAGLRGHTRPDRERKSCTYQCTDLKLWITLCWTCSASYYCSPIDPAQRTQHCSSTHVLPLLQVRQHHIAIAGDILSSEDHHLTCGFDIADGCSLGVTFLKPQAYGNVIGLVLCKKKKTMGKGVFYFTYSQQYLFVFDFKWSESTWKWTSDWNTFEKTIKGLQSAKWLLPSYKTGMVPVRVIKSFLVPSL